MLVCIVGESCSGKDTLASMLESDGDIVLKSYTTRPRRQNEGSTHIFIKPYEVEQYKKDIVAYTKIGGYEYFATKNQVLNSEIYVVDPDGISSLKKSIRDNKVSVKLLVIYINVSCKERFYRAINIRKDNKQDVYKRYNAERAQFDSFKTNNEFDYCIPNKNIGKAYNILNTIIKLEKGCC